MQTCRQYYHLHQQKAQSKLRDDSGVTLVELLAALTIFIVVIILAGSIHMFGQRQFISQTDSASQANDFSYALTDMTTEIRKRTSTEVKVTSNRLDIINIIENGEDEVVLSYTYHPSDNTLRKNGSIIADSVGTFNAFKDDPDSDNYNNSIEITLKKENQTAGNKNYQTRIYFRGE